MKRFILFLLVGALLLLPLSGCFADKKNEGTTPGNTTENTTPDETTPDNPPEVTTPEATTPPENGQNDPPALGDELNKDSDLIVELVAYWKELSMDILIYPFSFTQKIYTIEQGKQPLHVAFDPNDYYFVCAYNSSENGIVFSYDDCIWVRYASETAIQEYYNGKKLSKAFQINRSFSVIDLLPGDKAVPDIEHFIPYDPVFENGFNTAAPVFFNETFIYLNDSTDETIYYSMRQSTDMLVIPCVYFESQYYLSFRHYVIDSDGKQGEKGSYEGMFGDYCNVLSNKAVAEKYSITNDSGTTWFYVLVPLEDFVNGVLK